MATGKGGKSDPAKHSKKDKTEIMSRHVLKMSQSKSILRTITRMRVSSSACAAMMFSLTYLIVELIDGSHNACVSDQKRKITPKHLNQCIALDNELGHIAATWLIKSGGAVGYLKTEEGIKKRKEE